MDPRDEWLREVERRQDNIDPIRRIPNYALFQGSLINGNRRLNTFQRVAAIFVGACGVLSGIYFLVTAFADLHARRCPEPWFAVSAPCSLWFGWKIAKNAIVNNPEKAKPIKS
jgi:hypothetical protein